MISDKQLIPYYLMSCYLYYHKNDSVLNDMEYNKICDRLIDNLDNLEHQHKHLVKLDDLKSQGSPNISFPNIVKRSAMDWLKDSKKQKVDMSDIFE